MRVDGMEEMDGGYSRSNENLRYIGRKASIEKDIDIWSSLNIKEEYYIHLWLSCSEKDFRVIERPLKIEDIQ